MGRAPYGAGHAVERSGPVPCTHRSTSSGPSGRGGGHHGRGGRGRDHVRRAPRGRTRRARCGGRPAVGDRPRPGRALPGPGRRTVHRAGLHRDRLGRGGARHVVLGPDDGHGRRGDGSRCADRRRLWPARPQPGPPAPRHRGRPRRGDASSRTGDVRCPYGGQAAARPLRSACGARPHRAPRRPDRCGDRPRRPGPGAVPAVSRGPRWPPVPHGQVPDHASRGRSRAGDAADCERADRATVQARARPSCDAHRTCASRHVARRAAAVVERAARRDEPRGAAAGAARRGRPVRRPLARPSSRAARCDRSVAGAGSRQSALRRLSTARPVLRRQLVVRPRPDDPRGHGSPCRAACRAIPTAFQRRGVGRREPRRVRRWRCRRAGGRSPSGTGSRRRLRRCSARGRRRRGD